jgi:hypothetical protein
MTTTGVGVVLLLLRSHEVFLLGSVDRARPPLSRDRTAPW